jgi:hypothetical protein
MKAIKMMMFVAAATMLFASCNKDELDLENNQLRYDGTVYNMVSSASSDTDGSYVSFGSVGKEVLFQLSGTFDQTALNRTYDLTVAAEDVHYAIDFWSEALALNFSFDMNHGTFHGGMEGVPEGESIFSEGSCRIDYDNEGLTITLDGTLKNGKELAFKVFVPKAEMQMM